MIIDIERKVRMKTKALLLSVALILVVTGASSPVFAYSGLISIDTVEAEAGDHVAVPIRLSNSDEPISGLTVPVQVGGPHATIDSVSFVGSLLPANFTYSLSPPTDFIDSVEITLIGYWETPTPTITATEGIIATLYLTVSPSAPDGSIPIDTFYAVDSFPAQGGGWVEQVRQLNASDQSGLITYFPEFDQGGIIVMSSTAIDDDLKGYGLPDEFGLAQNYPNPFNPVTTIEYYLPRASKVRLEVFNVLGQSVVKLVDGRRSAGRHLVDFNASGKPSGIYFYRLTHGEGTETRKMTLVK